MSELGEAWRLVAETPVESACALASLTAFVAGLIWGVPLIAVGLGWA